MASPSRTILAFDTSAAHCAAALLSGERVVGSLSEDMARGQAERLVPLLESLLNGAGLGWADLDAIGVGTGPGNFTGIRISVALARGLSLSLGIPAIGVSRFEALGHGSGFVVASVEGPRDTIYSVFPGSDPVQTTLEAMPLPPGRAEADVIGHRADEIAARTGGQPRTPRYPLPEAIARVAASRVDNVNIPRPKPMYIRAADAAPASDPPPVILP